MKTRIGLKLTATLPILLLATACNTGKIRKADTADLESLLGKGVQCFLVPSEHYKPGTVFRIDEQGETWVANRRLAEQISTSDGNAALGTISGKQSVNIAVLASLLNLAKPGEKLAQINASVARTRTLDVQVSDLKLEITDDQDIDGVLKWFADVEKKPKNRYFVVREAYTATAMGLKVTKELKADFGGEAIFDQAIEATPRLTYDPRASYDLTAPFPSRLRVCIKPERLVVAKAGLNGSVYKTEPVEDRLVLSGAGGEDP